MNITSTPSLSIHTFLLLCHQQAPVNPSHTHKKHAAIRNKTHLVRKGATDGTKADEEAKTVARRMAWNFMVVICVVSVPMMMVKKAS